MHFCPGADDVKVVVLEMTKSKRFDVVDMLFLGGTSTIPRENGGFATAAPCKIPKFPLAKFIKSRSKYCTTDLLEQLLCCGVLPSGPPGNPPVQAWEAGRDDLLALLIRNNADLSDLQTKLFRPPRPDNMLHGALKLALKKGESCHYQSYVYLDKSITI